MSAREIRERRGTKQVLGVLLAMLAAVSLALFACDTAGEFEDCKADEASSSGEARCPPSTFAKDDARAREYELNGAVRRGAVPVGGAVVRMEPNRATGASFVPETVSTDPAGVFRVMAAPPGYDLWVQSGSAVSVHRELVTRRYEPTLEGDASPPGWTSNVSVRLATPIAEGHTVTFLGSGDDVLDVKGTVETGLVVTATSFTADVTIHAVEHPKGAGLAAATRHGKGVVHLVAGQTGLVELRLETMTGHFEVSFAVEPPPGFTVDVIDTFVDFGRRESRAALAQVTAGVPSRFTWLPDATYFYVARAHRDGAVTESGRQRFGDSAVPIAVKLGPPPAPTVPAPGGTVSPGDQLSAVGSGVLEHIFSPAEGEGTSLRIVTLWGYFPLPDAALIGAARPVGRYLWRVRNFPTVSTVDGFSGQFVRLYEPSAISGPREVVLR